MTKIIASVSKKMPVPGVAFSNQQFGGSLEVDMHDGATDEQLQARLQEMYALLGQAVESEIAAVAGAGGRYRENHLHRPDENRIEESRSEYRGRSGQQRYSSDAFRDGRGDGENGGDRPGYRRASGGGRFNSNNGGHGGSATQAQIKAVFGIAKGRGIERQDLLERVDERFGVRRIEELSIRQASSLIEALKAS